MPLKIAAGVLAAVLLLGYMAPVVLRLQDLPLWIVTGLGTAMMLTDLWQSLTEKD
jgi:hypothetical protein